MPRRLLVLLLSVVAACGGGTATTTSTTTTIANPPGATWVTEEGRVTIELEPTAGEVVVDTVSDLTGLGIADVVVAFRLQASGPLDGAVATVTTDVRWDDALPILVGVVDDADGTWQPVRTAAVASVGGMSSIGLQVPHAGTFALVATRFALDLEPPDRFAAVGEQWEVGWSILDASIPMGDTGPLVSAHLAVETVEPGASIMGLLTDVSVTATARGDGAVSPVPATVAGYGPTVQPLQGYEAGAVVDTIEVGGGHVTLTCLAPGAGYGGVAVELAGPARTFLGSGQIADSPISIRYDVAAPATCDTHQTVLLARYLQMHRGLSGSEAQRFVAALDVDGGAEDPADLPPPADLQAAGAMFIADDAPARFSIDRLEHPCGTRLASTVLGGLPIRIVCAAGDPTGPGEYVIVAATTVGSIPSEPEQPLRYTAAFESNGDPADDAADGVFAGTDRGYRVEWDPGTGQWSLTDLGYDGTRVQSSARVAIVGNTIVWLLPSTEIQAAASGFRVVLQSDDITDVLDAEPGTTLHPIGR